MSEIKEEAKALVEKFREVGIRSFPEAEINSAKQCAIIACKEKEVAVLSIIGSDKQFYTEHELDVITTIRTLRTEIEKL